jgi:hypothetical protein
LYSNEHGWQEKGVWALHRLRREGKKENGIDFMEKKCNLKEQ